MSAKGTITLVPSLGASVEIPRLSADDPELVRHRALLDAVAGMEFEYHPGRFAGRGIVICGGGQKYLPCTYVLVRMLRHLGCVLPVEVWHLGNAEMPLAMREVFAELGAVCVDALQVRRAHPARRLGGWELKCYAILHSAFEEVLFLDADNCPVRDPAFLFDEPPYLKTGAVFWPDFTRFFEGQAVWAASGIEYRDEPEFESGQIVVNKRRCWKALNVAMHLNEYSDWWYRLIHGDKDTFHLAWRKIGQSYAMPSRAVEAMDGTMLQFDFAGERLFQHRNFAKWALTGNRPIAGFRLEKECLFFLIELREKWTPPFPAGTRRFRPEKAGPELLAVAAELCKGTWLYQRAGQEARELVFLPDGTIGAGAAGCEQLWTLRAERAPRTVESLELRVERTQPPASQLSTTTSQLEIYGEHGLTLRARLESDGVWRGAWVVFGKGAVTLKRIAL